MQAKKTKAWLTVLPDDFEDNILVLILTLLLHPLLEGDRLLGHLGHTGVRVEGEDEVHVFPPQLLQQRETKWQMLRMAIDHHVTDIDLREECDCE